MLLDVSNERAICNYFGLKATTVAVAGTPIYENNTNFADFDNRPRPTVARANPNKCACSTTAIAGYAGYAGERRCAAKLQMQRDVGTTTRAQRTLRQRGWGGRAGWALTYGTATAKAGGRRAWVACSNA
jgi:hypothetical protein